MAMMADLKGREALMRRLNKLAPNVEKYAADAKYEAAQELAEAIRANAPRGATLEYAESIDGDFLKNRPHQERVGIQDTKDPSAAGIFAEFVWRFLEFGTAPHNTAKGGGTVRGKKQAAAGQGQMHPGTTAQPHIFPTYRAQKPKIRKKILAAVNKAVREAMGK
ncbi:HK97 gp10 family phage protein [Rhizobium leguminosarum]|uniref:HK97-gp10 family putative phage morphogenesis protein n=1 Tax=Rhizobium leguminosarum TaxID=384 RepID=UPI000FEC5FC5|nr:HK97-gp10 family putative phage morphogenesis protein [Rhizobium leguminosarum]RWX28955.1 HK97 gp10 family phage protein [Rhizobium leguminosarum]